MTAPLRHPGRALGGRGHGHPALATRKSPEKFFRNRTIVPPAVLAKVWQGEPVPPSIYRDEFPRRWARCLVAVFGLPEHGGVEAAAIWAEREERTMRYQFSGKHRPTGDLVARMALDHPAAFAHHCGAVRLDEVGG